MENLDHYLQAFANLRTDKSRARWPALTTHRAPYKPLLLLSVLDLAAQGALLANLVELSPDLGDLFARYWQKVMPPDRRGSLAMPFFHLQSDGFWYLVPRPGKEAFLKDVSRIHAMQKLRETVLGARLDEVLYELLGMQQARDLLRAVLVETYFSAEVQPALIEQGAIHAEAFQYSLTLLSKARGGIKEAPAGEEGYRSAARDQGFRRAVVSAYDHRCALCGIRMVTPEGHTAVDAAHIVPWSVSHDDDPRNGMALCRLCHWTFDEGLLGVSGEYRVLTSRLLAASENVPGHLLTLAGRGILGPGEEALWPTREALVWHRREVFLRG
jgi:putative restriction endonuclease